MMQDQFDLNLLRVFDALVQERKVVAAAHRLGLSAPAVSNALARLRRSTGDELFTRTAQGMLPTPYAASIADAVAQALRSIDASLARPARFVPRASARTWRIAMTDIGEIVFLPTLMRALQQQAPEVTVSTVRNTAVNLREAMASGAVDLAVGWLPDLDAGFHQRRLFEQRYQCLMSATHPLASGRLTLARYRQARHALVVAEGTGHERVDKAMRSHGVQRVLPLQLPHFVTVPWIVSETDLLVTVPQSLAEKVAGQHGLPGLLVREVPVPLPRFEVNLFWHRRVHADPAHRWMREMWAQLFGQAARKAGAAATATTHATLTATTTAPATA